MKNIEVEGLGVIEFPDDMSEKEISAAIEQHFKDSEKPKEPQPPPDKSTGEVVGDLAGQINKPAWEWSKPELPANAPFLDQVKNELTRFPVPTGLKLKEGETFKDRITRPTVPIPKLPPVSEHPTDPVEQGLIGTAENMLGGAGALIKAVVPEDIKTQAFRSGLNQAIGAGEFIESPLGLASIPAAAIAPEVTSGLFTADMLHSTLKQIGKTAEEWSKMTPEQKTDALVGIGSSALMTGMAGIHTGAGIRKRLEDRKLTKALEEISDASKDKEATTVHGDVRAQQPPPVPVPEQRGGEGVQPQAPAVGEETQVSLKPEDRQKLIALGFSEQLIDSMTPREVEDTLRTQSEKEAEAKPEGEKKDTSKILLSEFDAMGEGSQIIDWIMDEHGVTREQAQEIWERSRKHYGIDKEGQVSGKPKPEAEQAPATDEEVSITQNAQDRWDVSYKKGGRAVSRTFENEADAKAWVQLQRSKPTGLTPRAAALNFAIQKAKEKGSKIQYLTDEQAGPDTPFARTIAFGRNGTIWLNRDLFHRWLEEDVSPNKRAEAIERLMDEEHIHANTTNVQAKRYWSMLTPVEKLLVRRRYLGKEFGAKMSDTQLGHEALRGRIQRLSKQGIREAVDSALAERWTSRAISALENIMDYVREKLGTRASKIQRRILDKVQENLRAAQAAVGKQAAEEPTEGSPASLRKKPGESERDFLTARIKRLQSQVDLADLRKDEEGKATWSKRRDEAQRQLDSLPPEDTSGFPAATRKTLAEAKDSGELERWTTNDAFEAGLGFRSVADLDTTAKLHADLKAQYKAGGEKMAEGSREEQMDQITKQLGLAYQMQLTREAIEAATNAGSAAMIDIGERPLDYTKNPEVKAWLDKNAAAIGIAHGDVPMATRKDFAESLDVAMSAKGWLDTLTNHIQNLHGRVPLDLIIAAGKHDQPLSEIIARADDLFASENDKTELRKLYLASKIVKKHISSSQFDLVRGYVNSLTTGEGGPRVGPGLAPQARRKVSDVIPNVYKTPLPDTEDFQSLIKTVSAEYWKSDLMGEYLMATMPDGFEVPEKLTPEDIYGLLTGLATTKTQDWPLSPETKSEMLKFFEDHENDGLSRKSLVAEAAAFMDRDAFYTSQNLKELIANRDLLTKQFTHEDSPTSSKEYEGIKWMMDREIENEEAALQHAIDRSQEMRRMLKSMTGDHYPPYDALEYISPDTEYEPWSPLQKSYKQAEFPGFEEKVEEERDTGPTGFELPPPEEHPELPFARRKSGKWKMGKYEPADQGKFFLPAELPEQERQRVSAEESGAYPFAEGRVTKAEREGRLPAMMPGDEQKLNANDIVGIAQSYLNSKIGDKVRPSFQEFSNWAQRRLRITPNAAADVWNSEVWSTLIRASGERLESWVRALNLENKLAKAQKGEGIARIRSIASLFSEVQVAEEAKAKFREGLMNKATRNEKRAAELELEASTMREQQERGATTPEALKAQLQRELEDMQRKLETAQKAATDPEKSDIEKERLRRYAADLTKMISATKTRAKAGIIGDPFQRLQDETAWRSSLAKAKKLREEADELVRAAREAELTPPTKMEAKTVDKAAKAAQLRRRAKSLKDFADELPGDSQQLKAAYTLIDALNARADILEKGGTEESAEAVKGKTEQEQAAIKAKQFRDKVISEIARTLIKETIPKDYDLHRTEVAVADIDFDNLKRSEAAYHEVSPHDLKSPNTLTSIYRDGARRSSDDPVSVTKRLAVVRDTKTGAVFMLSAYPDGRRGIQIMDPYGTEHIGLLKNLKRFQPVASVLVKDAVRDFKWKFKNLKEYNEKFGTEAAKEESHSRFREFAGERAELERMAARVPELEPDIEGTEGIKTSSFVGPGAETEGRGAIERTRRTPLTGNELESVFDYITDHVGTDASHEEFARAITDLQYRAKELAAYTRRRGKKGTLTAEELTKRSGQRLLRGMHRNVLSAITKIANFIYREEKEMIARVDAYAMALDHIYEAIEKNKQVLDTPQGQISSIDTDRAVSELLGRFTRAPRQERTSPFGYALRRFLEPRSVGVTKEIGGGIYGKEMFRGKIPFTKELSVGRVPPTTVRESQIPESERGKVERKPAPQKPEGSPGEIIPPKLLSEAERLFVEERAAKANPYRPTVAEEMTPPLKDLPEARRKGVRDAMDFAEASWVTALDAAAAGMARRDIKDTMSAWADRASNKAVVMSRQSGNSVRIWSDKPIVRNAAIAAVSSGGDLGKVRMYVKLCDTAIAEAKKDIAGPNRRVKIAARARLKAAQELKEGAEYLLNHPSDAEIHNTANAAKRELQDAYKRETAHGIRLHWEPDYMPSRYEGEFFNDDAIMFWEQRVLGLNFRKPKVFANYYEAIAAGPYVPRTLDVAELVEHRVRQGATTVNTDAYLRSLRNLIDPKSGEAIAKDAIRQRIFVPATKLMPAHWKLGQYMSPGPEYRPIQLGVNHVPIYVRHGFHSLANLLTLQGGGVSASPMGKIALQATGALKHSVILIMDTFHPLRLGQYAMASTGIRGYKGALSALEFSDRDLPQAVRAGLVSAEAAKWALKPVTVTLPTGRKAIISRRQVLDLAIDHGLNVGRIQDALYRNIVNNLDLTVGGKKYGLGAYNRWVFDKFTRGMMATTVIKEFEQAINKNPGVSATRLMRDIVKDTNIYYGSLGRQGWIKNPTYREISQLLFLAPQWVESLVQKEARFASRLTGVSYLTGRKGLPYLGQMGKAVGKGLAFYFALTQALNLVARGKFTWQNPEPGHELDAMINLDGNEFWLSPLSVFAEITHDVLRLTNSKPTVFHAIRQIGDNKLGPWGRLLVTMATLESPTGIRPQTAGAVASMAADAAMPVPISFGKFARAGAHQMFPNTFADIPKGAGWRQAVAMGGVKIEPARTPSQLMSDSARKWLKDQGLEYKPYLMTPTEEASYDKLRNAIRNDDRRVALQQLNRLREFKSDTQIVKAMKNWSKAPFTGRNMYEKWFMGSMDDQSRDVYSNAVAQRLEEYNRFMDFMMQAPEAPPRKR